MTPPHRSRIRRPSRVYQGWWILGAISTMMAIANGVFFRGFPIFFVPVRESLGLSNFRTSLVFSIARASVGLAGPPAGLLIDRVGYHKLAVAGVLLASGGYFAFSRVDSFLWFALAYAGLISLGNSVGFQNALDAGVTKWFRRRLALAFSIYAAAGSLGGVVLIPIINLIIIEFGWEKAALVVAFTYLLVLLPLALLLRPSPESMGLLPDGDRPQQEQAASAGGGPVAPRLPGPEAYPGDFSVPEAMRNRVFWLLMLGIGLFIAGISSIEVNLQPLLVSKGVSLGTVGLLLSLMMGIRVIAVIPIGLLADRWPKPVVLAGLTALAALAVIFLLPASWQSAPWAILVYVALTGIGDRAFPIGWATVGDFFGRHRFASLKGLISFSHSWALIAAPVFVGWWADRTGEYTVPMWTAMVLLGLSSLCFSRIGRPRRSLGETPASP